MCALLPSVDQQQHEAAAKKRCYLCKGQSKARASREAHQCAACLRSFGRRSEAGSCQAWGPTTSCAQTSCAQTSCAQTSCAQATCAKKTLVPKTLGTPDSSSQVGRRSCWAGKSFGS